VYVAVGVLCVYDVLCVFGVGVVCSNSLYVFFVSCSDVSTCLPNALVFEFSIFAVHLVYAAHVIYVCGVRDGGRPQSEFLATNPEVRVPFPALPDFLRSSGSGTRSTQPREYNRGAAWNKK
jgi:hypothetical protein